MTRTIIEKIQYTAKTGRKRFNDTVEDILSSDKPFLTVVDKARGTAQRTRKKVQKFTGTQARNIATHMKDQAVNTVKKKSKKVMKKIEDLDLGDVDPNERYVGIAGKFIGKTVKGTLGTTNKVLAKGTELVITLQKNADFERMVPGYKAMKRILGEELSKERISNTIYTKGEFSCRSSHNKKKRAVVEIDYNTRFSEDDKSDALLRLKSGVNFLMKKGRALIDEEYAQQVKAEEEKEKESKKERIEKITNNRAFLEKTDEIKETLSELTNKFLFSDCLCEYNIETFISELEEVKETLYSLDQKITTQEVSPVLTDYKDSIHELLSGYTAGYEQMIQSVKGGEETTSESDSESEEEIITEEKEILEPQSTPTPKEISIWTNTARKSITQVNEEFNDLYDTLIEDIQNKHPEEVVGEEPRIYTFLEQRLTVEAKEGDKQIEQKIDALFNLVKENILETQESIGATKSNVPVNVEVEKKQLKYALNLTQSDNLFSIDFTPRNRKNPFFSLIQKYETKIKPEA